ncbi:unnamed protein product, partial [Prorocentrum cordatum]
MVIGLGADVRSWSMPLAKYTRRAAELAAVCAPSLTLLATCRTCAFVVLGCVSQCPIHDGNRFRALDHWAIRESLHLPANSGSRATLLGLRRGSLMQIPSKLVSALAACIRMACDTVSQCKEWPSHLREVSTLHGGLDSQPLGDGRRVPAVLK